MTDLADDQGRAVVPGSWNYPYATDPHSLIVPAEQLQPAAGQPLQLQPVRVARDPRHTTLAAVITFVSLVFGLWAVL
ncbi:MAG: hypothetical protein JWN41_1094, partial [Thermoleophilia bacterium]|nr:hypothetical protein [Thermoleophilia bacterium]